MSDSSPAIVDIFVEDHAHEAFIRAAINRCAREKDKIIDLRVRNARGGHGRVMSELKLFQRAILTTSEFSPIPDVIVIAIDANCKGAMQAQKNIAKNIEIEFTDRTVIACPDPHIEKWYMADPNSFYEIIGRQPRIMKSKCERGFYKNLLEETIRSADHLITLGGIEFAEDLVNAMDFYRAGKNEQSLNAFLNELGGQLKRV